MLFACLATFLCVCVGVGGITIACIDINRFNFGLYVALLSVLGTTVSIAFWIVKPKMCDNPRCVQRIINHLRTSFSTSFGGPPKGHSSKHDNMNACSNESTQLSSNVAERDGQWKWRKQQKKNCSSVLKPMSFRCDQPVKTKSCLRRSSTWCNVDDQLSLASKLGVPQKELSWRDNYWSSEILRPFSDSEPSTSRIQPQSSRSSRKSDKSRMEATTKNLAINLLPPPVTLVQAHSSPSVNHCTSGFKRSFKQSHSLTFLRRFLAYDEQTDAELPSENSDETESSTEQSDVSGCSGIFEFRLIPYPLRSEDSTNDSWITRTFSSGSNWKYQILEKMSSSQSLSTLV